jgi:hypothetical protein
LGTTFVPESRRSRNRPEENVLPGRPVADIIAFRNFGRDFSYNIQKEVCTMKKKLQIVLMLFMAAALVTCAEKAGLKAGTATAKSMLKLIPADARLVMMVDVHRTFATDDFMNAMKDEKMRGKYEEFVKMAGLDPQKDIYWLAVALHRGPSGNEPEGAVIVNLRYNKDILLAKLKEKAPNLSEETYNGVTLYKGFEPKKSGTTAPTGAFLDDSNIIFGSVAGVRSVIDVYQKKADSVAKSDQMKNVLKAVNMSAVFWGALAVPQDLIKQAAEKNPMIKNLVGITGLAMSFDYANRSLVVDIQALGGAKDQNKNLADQLTGFKGMGVMFAAKEPLLGDLLNTIEISSGADSVKIYASIPGELLDKARAMAQERFGKMIQFNPPAEKEVKK